MVKIEDTSIIRVEKKIDTNEPRVMVIDRMDSTFELLMYIR